MTATLAGPTPAAPAVATVRRWPALAAAAWVGTFCVVTGSVVTWALLTGGSLAENGVVLLAVGLRVVTVLMALAAVQRWGRLVPGRLLLAGLWGAAAIQLA